MVLLCRQQESTEPTPGSGSSSCDLWQDTEHQAAPGVLVSASYVYDTLGKCICQTKDWKR